MHLDMKMITDVVDSPQMGKTFNSVVKRIQEREDIPDAKLKLAMGIVLVTLVLKNYQCPGAMCNCTVQQYQLAMTVDDTTVIKVADHKTAKMYGSAKLVVDAEMKAMLAHYFTLIQPKLAQPGNDVPNLFILPGSKPVRKIGNLSRLLQSCLKVSIPMCSMARKIGAMCAACTLGDADNLLIGTQMSHSPAVTKKYYQALTSCKDAVSAYKKMEGMRTVPSPSPVTSGKSWSKEDARQIEKNFQQLLVKKPLPSV